MTNFTLLRRVWCWVKGHKMGTVLDFTVFRRGPHILAACAYCGKVLSYWWDGQTWVPSYRW